MANDGGPAFPSVPTDVAGSPCEWEPGMTVLDIFAAFALSGWVNTFPRDAEFPKQFELVARDMYRLADAMLAERERRNAAT